MRFFILLLTMLFTMGANTQTAEHNHALLLNVGTVAFGNFELSFEKKFDKHFSLSSIASYYDFRAALARLYSKGYQASLGIAPKFHVFNKAHNSVYLAPTLKIGYLAHPAQKPGEESDQNILVRTGGVFGYTHTFHNRIVIDLNAGLEHYQNFRLDKEATRMENDKPILIRFISAISVGFAF